MIIIAVLFLILALAAAFFFWKWLQLKNNPDEVAEETTQQVLAEVGSIYELPTGEEPTIAKVQNKDKLSGQQFFESAQNGDYILIYSKKKLALLYRQEDKKLINVSPIAIPEQEISETQ